MKIDSKNNAINSKKNNPENTYEEIADFSETISEGVIVNGNRGENIEEEYVIDLELKDFEELGKVDTRSQNSLTIIDELGKDSWKKEGLSQRRENLIDIEKLSVQINRLTSVKKRNPVKKPPAQTQQVNNRYSGEEEKQEEETVILESKAEKEQKQAQNIPEPIEEPEPLEALVIIDEVTETEEIDSKEEYIPGDMETRQEETGKETESKKELTVQNQKTVSPPAEGNTLTIEIPDKLLEELPEDFNLDEFGKVNLKEAEIIAEEDILSFAKGDLLEELKGLDIFPGESSAKTPEKEIHIDFPSSGQANIDYPKENSLEIKEGEDKLPEPEENIIEEEGREEVLIKDDGYTFIETLEVRENEDKKEIEKIEIPVENENKAGAEIAALAEEVIKPASIESAEDGLVNTESLKYNSLIRKGTDQTVESQEKIIKEEEKEAGMLPMQKEENIFFIDNENLHSDIAAVPVIDELTDIPSAVAGPGEGRVIQLTESDASGKKAITGLIRDNYPTFKDLLKEKEPEDKYSYFDEDINFIDTVFLSKNPVDISIKSKHREGTIIKEKISMPYEQIMGLLPEEISLIENQLYKIKSSELDLDKTSKLPGFDQHPSDTTSLNKYKYILPAPDSLMDKEKKSIENDISASSALIYEEDVDRIRKRLEDSMKSKIKETIQDITDKIIIYEDSEDRKEEIKKLLTYLNGLLEKLPEENIEHFANSEYYELYKKILNDTET